MTKAGPSLHDVSPPPSVSGAGIYNKRMMIRLSRWGLCKQLSLRYSESKLRGPSVMPGLGVTAGVTAG